METAVAFVALVAASLAGCSAVWGFQGLELAGDASMSGDATRDGKAPPDVTPEDVSAHDGTGPVDASLDALDASAPDAPRDAPLCDPASVDAKLVFITSMATGSTGVLGKTNLCEQAASASGLGARRFVAWVSTNKPASARFIDASAGPYRRPDNQPVASSLSEMVMGDADLMNPIDIALDCKQPVMLPSPAGCVSVVRPVWTGTLENGMPDFNCQDWTQDSGGSAMVGNADQRDRTLWTQSCTTACNAEAYLYCIEY